jgi:T5SS/PEP-CTERM-associated repeat protein
MIRRPRSLILLIAAALITLASEPAWGTGFSWSVAQNGLFNTPANWTPAGPPTTSADTAEFNLNGAYTVTFQTNVTNSLFGVDNGSVTFALSGTTYTPVASGNGSLIGSIAGQTGQLTVFNGRIVGGFTVGSTVGATGILTIDSDAIWNTNGLSVSVGQSGLGTLTISDGGQFTSTNTVFLGGGATGNGTLNVTGADSSFICSGVTIGNLGIGHMTVSDGGTAKMTQAVTLASSTGTIGSLTVTGGASLFDTATAALTVGGAGAGHLLIADGATINCGQVTLANNSGSTADATVTGLNSTWNVNGQLLIGNVGAASLTIADGATLTTSGVTGTTIGQSAAGTVTLTDQGSTWIAKVPITLNGTSTLTVGSGTTLTMPGTTTNLTMNSSVSTLNVNGGTIDVGGSFSRLGNFNFNDGTLIVRGAYSNGNSGPLTIDGNIGTALPTLELFGNFNPNTSDNITTITVGNLRQGALVIADGRNINIGANNVSIGVAGGSNGSLTLSGGATLTTNSTTSVGGSSVSSGGTGLLTINTDALLNTNILTVWPGGTVVLNGGGSINLGTLSAFGGAFQFNSGTLNFIGPGPTFNASQLDFLLGAGHALSFGRTVTSLNTPTISAPLTISGGNLSVGSLTNASTLTVTDGTLAASSTLTDNANALLLISSTGSVSATSGITNNGTIQLNSNLVPTSGGTLSNSATIRGTGFIGNNLTNNAAGQVQVTTGNRLEFEGATNTNTGLISLNGGELVFDGPLTNTNGTGLISGHDAIIRTGGITNNGSLGFTAGTMDVFGKITNNVGGLITCSGGGTTTFYDDVTIAPSANSVRVSAVGTVVSKAVFFGSYNGGNPGGGTVFIEGDHRPGNSPGVVNFGGDLVYDGLSELFIDIGGTTPGNGSGHHDQVNVAGALSIAGGLELDPYGGFVPVSGDKFVIMTYGSLTGTFAPVTGTSPAPGLTYNPVYLANGLVVLTTTNGEKTWGVDSDGNASVGSNWIGSVAPGGIGDMATFSTIITAPRVVTLDADTTLGTIKFDSPISYTIAGPHTLTLQAAGADAATISDSNVHGDGAHTISAPITLASDLNIVQNSGGTLRLTGPLNNSAAHAITKSGAGTVEVSGTPTLGAGTPINVSAGTLRFALSDAPTLGSGVTASVTSTGTLELAGAVSSLAVGNTRVNVSNTSSATTGIHVTGTNQVVGGINGSGATGVDAGSNLTANHIVQNALIIGGTLGNSATVTIAASDASGNPLGSVLGTGTISGAFGADSPLASGIISGAMPSIGDVSAGEFSGATQSGPGISSGASQVPEPSTLVLLAIAGLMLVHVIRPH